MTTEFNSELSLLPEVRDDDLGRRDNIDLIGESYFSQGSIIRVVEVEAARAGRFVIVEDITRKKRWSVPAALIRLIVGRRKDHRWKKNAA